MKKIIHQSKIHYYILFLIVLCPCIHAATSKKADRGNTKREKSQIQQPVHQAAIKGNMPFFMALLNNKSITHTLNKKDQSDNWTPLHYATAHNKKEVVRFILSRPNITINAITKDKGSTALHILIQEKNFDLLDCFIAYKQEAQKQQFTRLYPKKKDKSGKIPSAYFPKEDGDEKILEYKSKWNKLVDIATKKSKTTPQNKPSIATKEESQGATCKAPLPKAINMEPLSPTKSNADIVTFSPASSENVQTDRNTVPNQPMDTTIKENTTIQQMGKAVQPNTTQKTQEATSTAEKSQQPNSPDQQLGQSASAANITSLQATKPIATEAANIFYYLKVVVGVLLLGSIFYLVNREIWLKA